MVVDPGTALANAIANSRAQQVQQMQQQPGGQNDPTALHALASQLAQHLAAGRQPLGQAKVIQPRPNPGGLVQWLPGQAPINPGGLPQWLPGSQPAPLHDNPLSPTYRPLVFPGNSVAY